MIDPAECRRLAGLCFDDDVGIPATSAVTRIVDHLPQVASALTDAAELAERSVDVNEAQLLRDERTVALAKCRGLEVRILDLKAAVGYEIEKRDRFEAERDAARAEVERLRAGIRDVIEEPCLTAAAVYAQLGRLLGGP